MVQPNYEEGSQVLIYGYWDGISCAYYNSVFGGQCVPEVLAVKIDPLSIKL